MKIRLIIITLAFITIDAYSQITVTDNDIISVGDIIYEASDYSTGSAIVISNAGANQIWDFSSLQALEIDTIEVLSPVGTPFESLHPNANLCVNIDDELLYLEKNPNILQMVGYGNVPANMMMLPLPLTYGLTHQGSPNTVMDSVLVNMFFADSLAPYISMNPMYDQIDSLNIKAVITSHFNIDAWGTITIPSGSFDALRLHVEEINTTEAFVYCSNSAGLGGAWYPMPPQFFPTETETGNRYEWWSNHALAKFRILELQLDSLNNVSEAIFLHGTSTSVDDIHETNFKIYPNPTSEKLVITSDLNECEYILFDMHGRLVLRNQFIAETSLSLDGMAKGVYYITLKTEDLELTKKVVIE